MIDERTAELLADLPPEAWGDGAICSTCEQPVRVYRRTITRAMVIGLAQIYHASGVEVYTHLPTVTGKSDGQVAKLAYWHLIAPGQAKGYWRCTPRGRDFLQGKLSVPHIVRTYNGKVIDFQGEPVDVHAAYGTEFML